MLKEGTYYTRTVEWRQRNKEGHNDTKTAIKAREGAYL